MKVKIKALKKNLPLKKKMKIKKIKLPVRRIRIRPVEEEGGLFLHGGVLKDPETKKPMLGWK